MITAKTGCILVSNKTGEKLPITSLNFDRGGAISSLYTLEDDIALYNDASILETLNHIEIIECKRLKEDIES